MSSGFAGSPHTGSDYIGPATIVVHDTEIPVLVELRGYREPIDGIFRWFGRIRPSDELPSALGDEARTRVTIRTERSAREVSSAIPTRGAASGSWARARRPSVFLPSCPRWSRWLVRSIS